MRFNSAPGTGGLAINALNPPGPQETSKFLSLVTNAKHFDLSGTATVAGYLIDEDRFNAGEGIFAPPGLSASDIFSVTVTGLAVPKVAPVPLPASALLLGAGLAASASCAASARPEPHRAAPTRRPYPPDISPAAPSPRPRPRNSPSPAARRHHPQAHR